MKNTFSPHGTTHALLLMLTLIGPASVTFAQDAPAVATTTAGSQFLNAAWSGDNVTVESLMSNPELALLFQQAQSGLSDAAGELPGNAARSTISSLMGSGANAGALAQTRGIGDLFGAIAPTFAS